MSLDTWEADRQYHMSFLATESGNDRDQAQNGHREEAKTTPLFSAEVLGDIINPPIPATNANVLPQYGLLAQRLCTYGSAEPEIYNDALNQQGPGTEPKDNRVFLNVNTPWSAFICGSQGSGKSHTLSCMLENALYSSRLGRLPRPLAGLVFHYDKFSGFASSQVCEVAYLCSIGIPVKVMVSLSNISRMKKVYENLPGIDKTAQPEVVPLLLKETQLNVERMMNLMAVGEREGAMPLYMEVVNKHLRQIALERGDEPGLDYAAFKGRLDCEDFNEAQRALLHTRLQLLESFMSVPCAPGAEFVLRKSNMKGEDKTKSKMLKKKQEEYERRKDEFAKSKDIWSFKEGSLTIVDLSCPFVDESAACALFEICLALFLEKRGDGGRIVSLDEAHKFMTDTKAANTFTESLLSVIRQQRHLATRVIIATQEPTISPKLLELSSMTIVHRFTSPNWLQSLKNHLAGIVNGEDSAERDLREIFKTIVNLEAGQALLFSPSAMLDLANDQGGSDSLTVKAKKLGLRYVKMRVRKRLTADGGRSILAA